MRSIMKTTLTKRQEAEARGRNAERAAAWLLRLKGYNILHERFKCPVGEIDLIAQKRDTLVFVEVKARATEEDALYALTKRGQRRIEQAALYFLSKNEKQATLNMRFDVVLAYPYQMKHLKNAWTTD